MDKQTVRAWIANKAEISFSRSSGPGGQNVNKVNTKATLFAPLAEIDGLTAAERSYLSVKLANQLTVDDVLVVQVQDTRSQSKNRALAVDRVFALIVKGLHRPKPRRPTKPSKGSNERRLETKKAAGRNKRGRKDCGDD